MENNQHNEIIIYQADATLTLDVRLEDETVWLTQAQMAELFQTTRNNITLHVRNIFKESELQESSVSKESLLTAADGKNYKTKLYSLDVIISVGYRVKSIRGTQFRIWANKILKEYLLRGYSVNQRIQILEDKVDRRFYEQDSRLDDLSEKVDFFVRSSLQPKEGIFFNNRIFDAYALVADLIRQAKEHIIVIDNYLDDTVLVQLSKRLPGVKVDIYSGNITRQLQQDVDCHNSQYPGVTLNRYKGAHDRFIMIDETVYHFGASLKDLGKKLFGFSQLEFTSTSEFMYHLMK